MKKIMLLVVFVTTVTQFISAQETNNIVSKKWEFNSDNYLYILPMESFFLPVIRADYAHLHLEARYNYEDMKTASLWAGYNFSGGNEFEYLITPMFGASFGNTDGIAPGLEMEFNFKGLTLYTESELLFDLEAKEDSYFYNWADFTYAPEDWIWFGISGQRTRTYDTELEYQRGIIIGGGGENWECNGYLYNMGSTEPFFILGFSFGF